MAKRFALVLCLVTLLLASIAPAAEEPAAAAAAAGPGLCTVLFENIEFKRPTGLAIMPQVNVDTGWKINDYSRVWIGHLKAPVSGRVEIFAEADDGLRLSMGGKRIIDGWGPDLPRKGEFTAEKDQPLPLRLEYFQNGGPGFMKLYWSWSGHERELIPPEAFSHTVADHEEAQKVMKAGGPMAALPVPPAPPDTPDKSLVYVPGKKYPSTAPADSPVPAHPGPHLFVDDALIESAQNVSRVIMHPKRDSAIPNPIVTGKGDACFQPYLSVSRSPENGRYRLWYGISNPDRNESASSLAYMESEDGIRWIRPHRIVDSPLRQFGSEVLDRGPYWPDASQRYVYSHWYGGLRLAVSADGLHFLPLTEKPLVAHNHDINSIAFDGLRQRYVATMSSFTTLPPRFKNARRTTLQSFSTNLLEWSPPVFVLVADDAVDEGQTQFYAMEGFLNRGPLRIGMVKVLRDDLFSDESQVLKERGGDFGIGYTTLAWTRDGEHWVRDREVFLDRGPLGSWDRSHAWIDEQVMVGDDEVYLYYAGYRSGHKANRFEDRQIGVLKMPVDRYVARRADEQVGTLRTVPLKLDAQSQRLLVNADAGNGELRAQVLEAESGSVVAGMNLDDCRAVTADGLRTQLLWGDEAQTRAKLAALNGKTVRLEFALKNASLFAFEFAE
jgi:hypothetical protein